MGGGGQPWPRLAEQEGSVMQNGTDLYALDISGASFVKACGGSTPLRRRGPTASPVPRASAGSRVRRGREGGATAQALPGGGGRVPGVRSAAGRNGVLARQAPFPASWHAGRGQGGGGVDRGTAGRVRAPVRLRDRPGPHPPGPAGERRRQPAALGGRRVVRLLPGAPLVSVPDRGDVLPNRSQPRLACPVRRER